MRKFKSILNEEDLKEIDKVKTYLEYSLKRRQAKKNFKLYINICIIYERYPNTIKEILDNIPTLGYYKDYFYVLMFSKNETLNDYIYNIIRKQLEEDLENLAIGKEISTLGKWLPREKSKINQRCNFIDEFNKRFFPDIKNKFTARSKYRKMKTRINEKLGTIETKLCAKQYDTIDYDKAAPYALKRATKTLMKHEVSRNNLDKHETEMLSSMTLSEFTKALISNKHSIQKMNEIWQQNNYCSEIQHIEKIIENAVCIADLSNDTYSVNGEFLTMGLILLVDKNSSINNKVFVGNNYLIKLEGNIVEKASQIRKYIGPCKEINVEKYYELIMKNNPAIKIECLIFITTKQINNMELLRDKNIHIIQIVPHDDTYDIIYHDDSNMTTLANTNVNLGVYKKSISMITNDSSEMNDKTTPIRIIGLLCMLFMIIKMCGEF